MITEDKLMEAIAECQGERNPNANTCIKLASFYTILDHIAGEAEPISRAVPEYAYKTEPKSYRSDTEFGTVITEMDIGEVMEVMDELMSTLSVVEPRLYASVMRKLRQL